MAKLSTYITFPGNAKEAFTHYAEVFGGDLNLMTYGDMPAMEGIPFTPDPQAIAHAQLNLPGGTITGGDAMPEETCVVKDTVYSLMYELDDVEQAKGFIDALLAAAPDVRRITRRRASRC
ncbi:hypothetical protein BSZ39_10340 [Bowdeniella nasicola]|uniref:PhnB protein n=1 Tax=Bowdeniella nasicola TaxID=208480 RepID=A0A1Q5Q0K2_9ACTO|nr:hypothetical protein [Bowdeniella nasicola]OKL53276.1 hypothetical protein BSZ39_10340 [Bowdeniella nasicola]